MASWDNIETDFGGDETANFGPRKETGSALYQIDTVTTVSCDDQGNKVRPSMSSCVLGDLTCLAVDKNLILQVQASSILNLDEEIEEVEWSVDGSTIVIGVRGGKLIVLDANSTEIIFSVNLVPAENHVNGRALQRILFSDTNDLVILTADGQLIVQTDINMLTEGDRNKNLITDGVMRASTGSQHSTVHDIIIQGDYIFTLGSGGSILCRWNYRHGCIELEDSVDSFLYNDVGLISGKITSDGHSIFALDENHRLTMWDASMFVCVKPYGDLAIADMCLLETETTSQNNSLKLVVITQPENGACSLKVQALPEWETVYNLQLSAPSVLAKCNTFQDMLYISEFCSEDGDTDTLSTLRFRCLSETDPKTRLYRILQKHKFEEAEQFAKVFKLEIELVRKVKANYLIDQLSPWNVAKFSESEVKSMMAQLWECLHSFVDDDHISTCMRAALPTYGDMEALFACCKSRLDKVDGSTDQNVQAEQRILHSKLLELQYKLMTFKLAFGEESFTGERWEQFMNADLLVESLKHLENGQIDAGFCIWTRHQASWNDERLSSELIQKILSTLHSNNQPNTLLDYLCTGLLPCVLRQIPTCIVDIVDFVIEKIKEFEALNKAQWPQCAIEFAEYCHVRLQQAVTVVIDDDTCMSRDNANKTRIHAEEVISPLSMLIVKLKELKDVLHKYKCRISLNHFLQETMETIAFRMLDKVVSVELISQTLQTQIRPYMKEHNLNQDQIFSKYIKDLLERYGQIQSFVGDAAWESKALAIIECITDVELKICAISEVMEWAPLPWNARVQQIAQIGLKIEHPKVCQLKEQFQQVQLRKLMMKYGMKHVDVAQGHDVKHLIYVMLSQDKADCIEDALEVMSSCRVDMKVDLYMFRIRQLIDSHKLEEAINLLRELPTDLGVNVGRRIVNFTMVKLNHSVSIVNCEAKIQEQKRLFTEAAILILKYLQSHEKDVLELEDLVQQEQLLINILALQVEYRRYITTLEYNDKKFRTEIMIDCMKEVFVSMKKSPQTATFARAYRLARILQIPQTTLQAQMAIKFANHGDIHSAVQICGELYESNPTAETAATLYEVVRAFLDLQAEIDDNCEVTDAAKLRLLPDVCYRLANQALCICSPDKLYEYLELCKNCSLLLSTSQQCESGESTLSAQWGEGTEFYMDTEISTGLTAGMFQEDALIMTSTTALPAIARYARHNPLLHAHHPTGSGDGAFSVETLCNNVLPIVQHLRGSSHLQLALSFSLHMLYTSLQYLQQQDMGLPFASQEQKATVQQQWKVLKGMEKSSQALLKELTFTTVMKIFNSSRVDDRLAFTYLCTMAQSDVRSITMKLIKMANHQYKKLQAVAALGISLGQIHTDTVMVDECQVLETDAAWGYRLSKLKICFKEAMSAPKSEKTKLLPVLAQNQAADINLVIDFCRSYELVEDDGLLLYLDHLFASPEDLVFDMEYDRALVIARAKKAIARITNTEELVKRIKKIYYRTSPYDYETIRFTLEVMQANAEEVALNDIPVEKGLQLLEYLKVVTRQAPPSAYENEYKIGDAAKQTFINSLSAESKIRLPFHPLLHGNPWKIIKSELSKETMPTWLLTAQLLKLRSDQIYVTAVQNMVAVYAESSPHTGESDTSLAYWHPAYANQTLLQDLYQVLTQMNVCENSLACSSWLVSKLPLGSERVSVLHQCIKLAELWHLSIEEKSAKREKAKAAYLRYVHQWQKMASHQALCVNGLAEPELLQNTDKPSVLIQQLYEHASICQPHWQHTTTTPDIHGAAGKIAEIHNIDIVGVQASLMEKWLQTAFTSQQDTEMTMTFSVEKMLSESVVTNQDNEGEANFKQIVYLVQGEHRQSNLMKLFEFALKPVDGQDTVRCIQALRCLLHLCDEETIMKECNQSLTDIRQLFQIMQYLAIMEKLHIRHTVDTFVTCQKEALVKGIWKNHSHEKTAVVLVSCLCLDYEIYDLHLWNSILQKLHYFGLWAQLEYVLFKLIAIPELWQVPALPKMWFNIISTALMKVCPPMTKEQTDICSQYLNHLFRCPVIKLVDGENLSRLYQKLELPACALGCLILTGTNDEAVKKVLMQYGNKIVENMTSLRDQNGLNHCLAVKIRDSLFGNILKADRYEDILGTPYQADFVLFCIAKRSVDALLVFAIKQNRVNEAKALVRMYVNTNMDVSMKVDGYIDEEEEEDNEVLAILKAYLRMQGLDEYISMLP